MPKKVVLRQIRIFLDEKPDQTNELALRITTETSATKVNGLTWSSLCKRWQKKQQNELTLNCQSQISIDVLSIKSKLKKRLGQAKIDVGAIQQNSSNELKNCIKKNGVVIGWLYCELDLNCSQQKAENHNHQYLSIYKIKLNMLDSDNQLSVKILLNDIDLFQKNVTIHHTKRVIFPNVKTKVKMSDGLVLKLSGEKINIIPLSFTMDQVQSGQMSTFTVWLRNQSKVKVGQVQIEYFLDSIHLENSEHEPFKPLSQGLKSDVSASETASTKSRVSIFKTRQTPRQSRFSQIKPIKNFRKSCLPHSPIQISSIIDENNSFQKKKSKKHQLGLSYKHIQNSMTLPKIY